MRPRTSPRDSAYEEAARWLVRQDRALDDHQGRSPASRASFQEWLAADTLHREAYEDLQRLWLDTDELSAQLHEDPSLAEGLLGAPEDRTRQRHGRRRLSIVAGLLLTAGLALALSRSLPGRDSNDVATGTAECREVTLADGSRIHLNAESLLRVSIDDRRREIELSWGEAVFSVTPDPDRPFVVKTAEGTVEAIGTEFNVLARDGGVEVLVLEGRVRVTPDARKRSERAATPPIEVATAGVAQLHEGQAISRIAPPDEIVRSLAWRDGELEFDDVPLAEVVRDVDPYVPGALVILGKELASMRVGGLLRIGEGHDPIEFLEAALPLEAIRFGEALTVLRRRDD